MLPLPQHSLPRSAQPPQIHVHICQHRTIFSEEDRDSAGSELVNVVLVYMSILYLIHHEFG
jgi:hypothetical protein